MPTTPLSPYSPFSAVSTATTANVPVSGYLVTTVSDGVAVATTARVAAGTTGTYDGVALESGTVSRALQCQRYGRVDASYVPTVGTSTAAAELVVVNASGAPKRQSADTGTVIGTADELGNLWLALPCPADKTKGVSGWARIFQLMGGA